jgi:hypothetical protein
MYLNPFLRAAIAEAYILALAAGVFYILPNADVHPAVGIAGFLSTLVFSVALMAYLFFAAPALLLMRGEGKEAIRTFLSTLGVFGAFALLSVAAVLVSGPF